MAVTGWLAGLLADRPNLDMIRDVLLSFKKKFIIHYVFYSIQANYPCFFFLCCCLLVHSLLYISESIIELSFFMECATTCDRTTKIDRHFIWMSCESVGASVQRQSTHMIYLMNWALLRSTKSLSLIEPKKKKKNYINASKRISGIQNNWQRDFKYSWCSCIYFKRSLVFRMNTKRISCDSTESKQKKKKLLEKNPVKSRTHSQNSI